MSGRTRPLAQLPAAARAAIALCALKAGFAAGLALASAMPAWQRALQPAHALPGGVSYAAAFAVSAAVYAAAATGLLLRRPGAYWVALLVNVLAIVYAVQLQGWPSLAGAAVGCVIIGLLLFPACRDALLPSARTQAVTSGDI